MFQFEMTVDHPKYGEVDINVEGHMTYAGYSGSRWQPPEPSEFEIDEITVLLDEEDPLYGLQISYDSLSKKDQEKLDMLADEAMRDAEEWARTEYLIDRYEDAKYYGDY